MTKLLPGWFPELTPEKQIVENNIKDIVKFNYERFWFVNIETPAVELNEVLTSKWWDEVSKQIYGVYGLKQWWEDLKNFSLHFDLTVPLARYVIDNESSLSFPFKRYQIQKVWRWERQQKWRFKEFTQCDVDVIWDNLSINYDIEVIHVLYNAIKEIFEFLKINKWIEVHLNNRKFIDWLCKYFSIDWENKIKFYNLLDSFYKITQEEFTNKLKDLVWENYEQLSKILKWNINELSFNDEELNNAFWELKETYLKLKKQWVNVIFDPYITRWLDYYTWTVFETFISDYFNFWSVCSWWRFDNLVWDMRKVANSKWINYWWVGWSIWLTRLFARLNDSGLLNKKIPLSQTIVFNTPWNNLEYREKVGNILRQAWISTDIYYEETKLWKQFSYAENKNIPFWIFAWADEEAKESVIVKNLYNRESQTIELNNLVEYIRDELNKILN